MQKTIIANKSYDDCAPKFRYFIYYDVTLSHTRSLCSKKNHLDYQFFIKLTIDTTKCGVPRIWVSLYQIGNSRLEVVCAQVVHERQKKTR